MKSAFLMFSLLILILLLACPQPEIAVKTPSDVPRYTADQVVEVAKHSCPSCFPPKLEAHWQVKYLGNQRWEVRQICTVRGVFVNYIDEWWFYETTGELTFIAKFKPDGEGGLIPVKQR